MRAIAQERRRLGYPRLHVLLKPEGYLVNHKKLLRFYREERLAVRRRGGRKRAIGTRAPMMVPMAPNESWSLDLVSDQLTDGRRFRILTEVDDCARKCLALLADTSLSGIRAARELDRLIVARPHSQLGWKTPSEFAVTRDPRRDLALRYADGSATAHVATTAQPGKSNRPHDWIKLGARSPRMHHLESRRSG